MSGGGCRLMFAPPSRRRRRSHRARRPRLVELASGLPALPVSTRARRDGHRSSCSPAASRDVSTPRSAGYSPPRIPRARVAARSQTRRYGSSSRRWGSASTRCASARQACQPRRGVRRHLRRASGATLPRRGAAGAITLGTIRRPSATRRRVSSRLARAPGRPRFIAVRSPGRESPSRRATARGVAELHRTPGPQWERGCGSSIAGSGTSPPAPRHRRRLARRGCMAAAWQGMNRCRCSRPEPDDPPPLQPDRRVYGAPGGNDEAQAAFDREFLDKPSACREHTNTCTSRHSPYEAGRSERSGGIRPAHPGIRLVAAASHPALPPALAYKRSRGPVG